MTSLFSRLQKLNKEHYGFSCWLRRHRRGQPDMRAYAVAGVCIDFCATCTARVREKAS